LTEILDLPVVLDLRKKYPPGSDCRIKCTGREKITGL